MSSIGANNSPRSASDATEYWLRDFFVLLTKSEEAVAATEAAAIATAIAVSLSTKSLKLRHRFILSVEIKSWLRLKLC